MILINYLVIIMYVCVCNAVTDRQIRQARDNGATTMDDLSRELSVATCCGRCEDCARKILHENIEFAIPAFAMDALVPA